MSSIQIPGSIFEHRAQLVIKRRIPGAVTSNGRPKYGWFYTGLRDTVRGRRKAKTLRRLIDTQLKPLEQSPDLAHQTKVLEAIGRRLGVRVELQKEKPVGSGRSTQQAKQQPSEPNIRQRSKKTITESTVATAVSDQVAESKTEVQGKGLKIKTVFEKFKEFRQLRPKTVQVYESVFRIITRGKNYVLTSERIEKDLEHFRLVYAKEKNFNVTSINTYLRQFQVFLNWCSEFGYLTALNSKKKYGVRTPPNASLNSAICSSVN